MIGVFLGQELEDLLAYLERDFYRYAKWGMVD